jgi:hypothetical protein
MCLYVKNLEGNIERLRNNIEIYMSGDMSCSKAVIGALVFRDRYVPDACLTSAPSLESQE